MSCIHCESKKGHFYFYCNCVKCWPILITLSRSKTEINWIAVTYYLHVCYVTFCYVSLECYLADFARIIWLIKISINLSLWTAPAQGMTNSLIIREHNLRVTCHWMFLTGRERIKLTLKACCTVKTCLKMWPLVTIQESFNDYTRGRNNCTLRIFNHTAAANEIQFNLPAKFSVFRLDILGLIVLISHIIKFIKSQVFTYLLVEGKYPVAH